MTGWGWGRGSAWGAGVQRQEHSGRQIPVWARASHGHWQSSGCYLAPKGLLSGSISLKLLNYGKSFKWEANGVVNFLDLRKSHLLSMSSGCKYTETKKYLSFIILCLRHRFLFICLIFLPFTEILWSGRLETQILSCFVCFLKDSKKLFWKYFRL